MRAVCFILLVLLSRIVTAEQVEYVLDIGYQTVHFSGQTSQAMAINGQIPGPVLHFTEGDIAEITVNNHTDVDASVHWHGLVLPQEQDGVPFLTQLPIPAGGSYRYRFPLQHAGTYWYHSHSRIDEQRGQYGAIVVHPRQGYENEFDHDVVVQLSDWTDEDPQQVLRNLKKDGHWYAHKKQSVISIWGYWQHSNLQAWASNRWQRMEGMDVSDVAYDAFLANGKTALSLLPEAKPGQRVRVRLINSGASSIFDIEQQSGAFTVVAADGVDVQPLTTPSLRISMAETYDFIVTIPASGGYQFAANNIDGSGGVKVTLGNGQATPAPAPKKPFLYAAMGDMSMSAGQAEQPQAMPQHHSQHAMPQSQQHQTALQSDTQTHNHSARQAQHTAQQHSQHHAEPPAEDHHAQHHATPSAEKAQPMRSQASHQHGDNPQALQYHQLRSREPVQHTGARQEFTLRLTGDMDNYNWSFNDIPLSRADKLLVERGNVVRFHFINESMMNHPLHLHGHFFKVLSGNGDHDVIKHTVNVPPMSEVSIEFAADAEKDWLFHCHNLYHAKTGMSRVVRYSDYNGNPTFMAAKANSNEIYDDDWYLRSDLSVFSHYSGLDFRASNNRHEVNLELKTHYPHNDENEQEYHTQYLYRHSRWLQSFVGFEREHDDNEWQAGLAWHAPFSIDTALWLTDEGKVRLGLETEFQLTDHWQVSVGANTEDDWLFTLAYRRAPNWSLAINGNETSGWGLGAELTF